MNVSHASTEQTKFRHEMDRDRAAREAGELQRQGFLMSEIAGHLGLPREHIANILYWEKVRT